MADPTEAIRRIMVDEINSDQSDRGELEQRYGQVWDTKELQEDFDVIGFLAPFVQVVRKADGKKGLMTFRHHPRFYFDFQPG